MSPTGENRVSSREPSLPFRLAPVLVHLRALVDRLDAEWLGGGLTTCVRKECTDLLIALRKF